MSNRQKDWILMLSWPLVTGALCLYFNFNFIVSIVFFYILPSIYVSIKVPGQIKRALVMALAGSLLWSTLDYIWELTGAWGLTSISQFKVFGVVSVEAFFWSFFWMYYIIIFYEYFFEKTRKSQTTTKKTKELLLTTILVFCLVGIVVTFFYKNLAVPYSYSIFGTLCTIPFFVIFLHYHKIRARLLHAGLYFSYATIIYEIVGLYLRYWWFPEQGQFLLRFNLFGFIIPLEEIVLWIILSSVSIISWYEFFDDDRKIKQ